MSISAKTLKKLPVGWRLIDNTNFVDAVDAEAIRFADRCTAEFDKLFGLYTRGDSQVVVMENAPEADMLTRARSILHDRGHRNILNWATNSVTGWTVSLKLFPKEAAA
jgi:hypothetical protein